MHGQLILGDTIFDTRGLVFVRSLKAVVTLGFLENSPDSTGARMGTQHILECLQNYSADSLILIGPVVHRETLDVLNRAFSLLNRFVRVHIVSRDEPAHLPQLFELYGAEWHHELVWAKYRFIQNLDLGAVELYFLSAIGGLPVSMAPNAYLKLGKQGFGGMKLKVFLKGLGQIVLPSLASHHKNVSVFSSPLFERYDVLAMGHTRVFPLGRISELKPVRVFDHIPLDLKTLRTKKKKKLKEVSQENEKTVV